MTSSIRVALFLAGLASAQSFEVASIHPHEGVIRRTGRSVSGPNITVDAYSVFNLIADAYNLREYQVDGASGWMTTDRFDIAARVAGERPPEADQVRRMLQNLLAERFQLKLHRETREISVYALVIAKGGPRLKENSLAEPIMRRGSQGQEIQMMFTASPLDMFARQLTAVRGLGRPVVDKTGLAGRYDFVLKLGATAAGVTGPSGESLFTAIEEQLGLKLESQKTPIEILVIDRAEKPSEN